MVQRSLIVAALFVSSNAFSGVSDFGTSGYIRTPDARMDEDSVLRATIVADDVADIFNITFQALPRVQTTFRYTIFNPRDLDGSVDILRDRSYAVKALLWEEGELVPQAAIGVRDILGTGAWEGEYFVVSKKTGAFDWSLGMGWGRYAGRGAFKNPLEVLDKSFSDRPGGGEVLTGQARGASFFRGNAALFGGLAYRFGNFPLKAIIEYESDDYSRERRYKSLTSPSALNYALEFFPQKNTSVRMSWLRGDTFGVTLSAGLSANKVRDKKIVRSRASLVGSRDGAIRPDGKISTTWYDHMLFDAERTGLWLQAGNIESGSNKASLVFENRSYPLTADAVNQLLSIGEVNLPRRINRIDLLVREDGMVGPTIEYFRHSNRQLLLGRTGESGLSGSNIKIAAPRKIEQPTNITDYNYPRLSFGADIAGRMQFFDPDDPARKQLYLKLTSRAQFSEQLNVWARYEIDLFNDFTNARVSNSQLEKVRSDTTEYLTKGRTGVAQLFLEYRNSMSPSVHIRGFAGILESMYAGIGGEVLYAPYDQRWAIGANVSGVQQRGFSRDFRLREYKTISGFVSAYYAVPFYEIDVGLHVGRYLARDTGYTLEARRSFDSGFSVGAFFTRTNVSAEEFGEGSFDKGLFFRIPFSGILPGTTTKSAYTTILRALERDGGRRLEDFGGNLWFERRGIRFDALDRHRARMKPR